MSREPRILHIVLTFCLCFVCANLLAQRYTIDDEEDVLSKKERQKLELVIDYELDFYKKIFLDDTTKASDVTVKVFKKYADYVLYQNEVGKTIRINSGGFYSSKTKEVVVCKDKHEKRFLSICYHELSHFFTHSKMPNPPAWLNEGLATYFGNIEVSSKVVKHAENQYYLGRMKTMIQLKDIDLKDFVTWKYRKFSDMSFSHDSYGYAVSYCMITFLLEKSKPVTFDIIREIAKGKNTEEAFNTCYSGGFDAFEKDFFAYCLK